MKVVLTDSRLKAIGPAAKGKRNRLWDAQMPGLAASITDTGRISFVVIARRKGAKKLTFTTLGAYPTVTLREARDRTPEVLRHLARGESPAEVQKEKLRAEERKKADTFESVAEEFFTRHLPTRRQRKNMESLIRRRLLGQRREDRNWVDDQPAGDCWRDTPITEITRRDVIKVIERFIDEGHRTQAKHLLNMTRLVFNWAIERDCYGIEVNPAAAVKSAKIIGKMPSRDRVLADDELRYVWKAAEKLEFPFGALTRMLMLTGQRLRDISDARWPEINADKTLLTIPAERYKIGRTHAVPLSSTASSLLEAAPRFKGEFIFTTTAGRRPVSGFAGAKRQLNREVARLRAEDGISEDMPPWVFHDLRRTMRTRLSGLKIADVVCELVIGHSQPGMRATYDLHRYDAEKRQALECWANSLAAIVERRPPLVNVFQLRA
jgi:integrase